MKQLILYFLVFVVSSLLLLQCAKYFPSVESAPRGKTSLKDANDNSGLYNIEHLSPVNANYTLAPTSTKPVKLNTPQLALSGFENWPANN